LNKLFYDKKINLIIYMRKLLVVLVLLI